RNFWPRNPKTSICRPVYSEGTVGLLSVHFGQQVDVPSFRRGRGCTRPAIPRVMRAPLFSFNRIRARFARQRADAAMATTNFGTCAVARVAGLPESVLRSWVERRIIVLSDEDRDAAGRGQP